MSKNTHMSLIRKPSILYRLILIAFAAGISLAAAVQPLSAGSVSPASPYSRVPIHEIPSNRVRLMLPPLKISPPIAAQSAVLIEAKTGTVLYSQNADERRPMASTTKIMTALVVLDRIRGHHLEDTVVVSDRASRIDGSRVYLDPGERQTVKDLLYALLLESANDAAIALAEHVCGSVEKFADLMNEYALRLGARHTRFENPHGLPSQDHYTTAFDLALISAKAMENPIFREIVKTESHRIPWPAKASYKELYNHNKLLFLRRDITGIKTGFTSQAGHCLVISAQKDGREVIAVLLDAEQPRMWDEVQRLIDAGLSGYRAVAGPDTGDMVGMKKFPDGTVVMARVAQGSHILIPADADPASVTKHIVWKRKDSAEHGERVATLVYALGSQTVAEFDLLADVSTYPELATDRLARDSLKRLFVWAFPMALVFALVRMRSNGRALKGAMRPRRRRSLRNRRTRYIEIDSVPPISGATSKRRRAFLRPARRPRKRHPSSDCRW
ncbi:MAG TPA: D-alanyl-D-alanine carboxypeptidase [Clostridia bacterium]|nr:D-alanyl-D-alanine carboxypeptidase [Clostridia bacterium]